ncbi:MAG: FecR domain-containing protein [Planctomycetales bacterium]|nr:FecR domain-containing protein [Planctomycetales bacterium]
MNTERLDRLLALYVDEALSAVEVAELEQLLLAWPQARNRFWQVTRLNSELRQIGKESWGERLHGEFVEINPNQSVCILPPVSPTPAISTTEFSRWQVACPYVAWLTAAVLIGLGVGGALLWTSRNQTTARPLASQSAVDNPLGLTTNIDGNQYASDTIAPQLQEKTATEPNPNSQDSLIASDEWIAVLRKVIDVTWSSEMRLHPSAGEPLAAGTLAFDKGLLELQTNRGALIVVDGPARLELISAMEVRCEQGRLRVDVPPPAHGFTVHTPVVNVVDRGTSFALNIQRNQPAEVHVLEGHVELITTDTPMETHNLAEGQSVSVDQPGTVRTIGTPEMKLFPSAAVATARIKRQAEKSFNAWQKQSAALQMDEQCLVHFDFQQDPDTDTVLRNRKEFASRNLDGTIIGCNWTEGRWIGKQALDFKNLTDRVRFEVQGQFEQVTLVASVRLDALEHAFNSILMSGDAVVGEMQWQISLTNNDPAGRMRVGRRPHPGWGYVEDYRSEPIFRREQFGKWLHLAIVWDAQQGVFRQFVDGQCIAEGSVQKHNDPHSSFIRVGELELGNWTPKVGQPREPVRNFSGLIDEFIMFSRALSDREIQNLFHLTWTGDAS